MKKAVALLLTGVLLISLMSCFVQAVEETLPEKELMDGSWEIYEGGETVLPEEVRAAFEKAIEGFTGSTLTPVAYIGKQVVAGMNYKLLCRCETAAVKPLVNFQLVTIYADLAGSAEITEIEDFPFWEMAQDAAENLTEGTEVLAGGWVIPDNFTHAVLPEEVQIAFDKATETLTGAGYTPMAYLGSQVVAGTNYALLCCSEGSALELGMNLDVIVIYVDIEGNAEII